MAGEVDLEIVARDVTSSSFCDLRIESEGLMIIGEIDANHWQPAEVARLFEVIAESIRHKHATPKKERAPVRKRAPNSHR